MTQLQVYPAVRVLEGAGFEVQRAIPTAHFGAVGPFIMLDHFGPVELKPGKAVGAPTHPHAGIETLTYLLEGSGLHYDSLGNRAVTGPGEAQWMRAGRGILHDEGPDEQLMKEGGRNHGVQLWLNMPGMTKYDAPEYRSFTRDMIPVGTLPAGGSLRVIAGEMANLTGPLQTHGDPFLVHVSLPAEVSEEITLPQLEQCGVFVLLGEMTVNNTPAATDELVLLGQELSVCVQTTSGVEFLILGGTVVRDELVRYGPFVANSKAEMQQVIARYQRGAFGTISKSPAI